jgi:hypothetical protein
MVNGPLPICLRKCYVCLHLVYPSVFFYDFGLSLSPRLYSFPDNQIVLRPVPADGANPLRVKVEICGREGTEQSTPPNTDTLWVMNEDLREFLLRKGMRG